jgi:hypothetical protein
MLETMYESRAVSDAMVGALLHGDVIAITKTLHKLSWSSPPG